MRSLLLAVCAILPTLFAATSLAADKLFRAGAFAIGIPALDLPVLVNCNMNACSADTVNDRLHARCIILDDGTNQAAIVIVDSCTLPRTLLDEAKELASKATGMPSNHILISATHA